MEIASLNLYTLSMFAPPIQDILTARLQALPEFVVAGNLRQDIDDLVARHISGGRIAVVDDRDTADAYGDHVVKALKSRHETTHITLPRGSIADDIALAEITEKSARADWLVAVGSGTINDLVKYAAHTAGKPYVLFPTAASMNGYVSATASIALYGHKQSLPASLPKAVFIDLNLVASAPLRLSQAGLGDSLARPTAQADWLLAHHVMGVGYDDAPYQLIAPYEAAVFGQADAIRHGDREAIAALLDLLFLSGFGMTIAGGSLPASGAEHMLAHAYGMAKLPPARLNLHGEEIAFTTLHSAALQESWLSRHSPPCMGKAWNTQMAEFFEATECAAFHALHEKKHQQFLTALPDGRIPVSRWEAACEAISAIALPTEMLRLTCKLAGLPTHPEALGWNAAHFASIAPLTRFTRDRVTFLDIDSM